jgi:hypothetical protein
MKQHEIRDPHDVRVAILAALRERGQSKYGFAHAVRSAGICRLHTVDSTLTDPGKSSNAIPTLATAIDLLHAAGYDLVAQRRGDGLPVTTKRRKTK